MMRLTALLLLASAIASAIAARAPKRGFVADGCPKGATDCMDVALLTSISWYYNYNPINSYANSPGADDSVFTPMHWCLKGLNDTIPGTVDWLMGFNEPNNQHNCNISPSLAASAWATVMRNWPTAQLVSPATAGNGVPWLTDFFAACKSLYGASGCRLSAVAVHDYSCTPSSTLAYVDTIHKTFGLPVWLTEFSCGDGAAAKPTADHVAYMKAVIPLLDASPSVARYSWMSAHDGRGLRGLVANNTLTELGKLYNSL